MCRVFIIYRLHNIRVSVYMFRHPFRHTKTAEASDVVVMGEEERDAVVTPPLTLSHSRRLYNLST